MKKINGKGHCFNTRIATVAREKSSQPKKAYWKCPVAAVYMSTTDVTWWCLKISRVSAPAPCNSVLHGKGGLKKQGVGVNIKNGTEPFNFYCLKGTAATCESISGFNLLEKYTRDITATSRETCLREVTLTIIHNWELPTRTASFTGACRIALSEQWGVNSQPWGHFFRRCWGQGYIDYGQCWDY